MRMLLCREISKHLKEVSSGCYQESVQRINDWRKFNGDVVSSDGRLIFLTHGKAQHNTIVFFMEISIAPANLNPLGR